MSSPEEDFPGEVVAEIAISVAVGASAPIGPTLPRIHEINAMSIPSQSPMGPTFAPEFDPNDVKSVRDFLVSDRPEAPAAAKHLRAHRGEVTARHGIARDRVRSALRKGA